VYKTPLLTSCAHYSKDSTFE